MKIIKRWFIVKKLSDTESNSIQILRGTAIIAVVFIHNIPDGLA